MSGSSAHDKAIEALNSCTTLMLDMDGTLLDLAYDNYMWLEHIPVEYARKHGIGEAEARQLLASKTRALEGRLEWYCLDHWSEVLDLDIQALHRGENGRIGYLPGAEEFLGALVHRNLRLLLVTNSHLDTLEIKTEVTGVTEYFDAIYTSHELGHAKEDQSFWHRLRESEDFDADRTLFIDDNLSVLDSAHSFGIGMLLNVTRPDTRHPARESDRFPGIEGVASLIG